jgi:hypothetical protein
MTRKKPPWMESMRLLAFSATIRPVLAQQKRVTRRIGIEADRLQVGDLRRAVDRLQGLGKGQRPRPLAVIRIEEVGPSGDITPEECALEGFPDKGPEFLLAVLRNMYGDDLRQVDSAAPGGFRSLVRIRFSYVAIAVPQIAEGRLGWLFDASASSWAGRVGWTTEQADQALEAARTGYLPAGQHAQLCAGLQIDPFDLWRRPPRTRELPTGPVASQGELDFGK